MTDIKDLKERLNIYIRKYYKLRLVKGLFLWLGLSLTTVLGYIGLEYWGHFASGTRTVMFWSFIALFFGWLLFYVVLPFLKMTRIISGLTHEDVAHQLNGLERGLSDKVLNTLSLGSEDNLETSLKEAAIRQKVGVLNAYQFDALIDWKGLKRLAPILFVPLLVLLTLIIWDPSGTISDSGRRLVNYDREFLPPAPFDFILERDIYRIIEDESIDIPVKLVGQDFPRELKAEINGVEVLARRLGPDQWLLSLEKVSGDTRLRFLANGYYSSELKISVYKAPSVSSFKLEVIPPAYTGLSSFSEDLSGLHRAPEGSALNISMLNAQDVERAELRTEAGDLVFEGSRLELRLKEELSFDLRIANKEDTIDLLKGTSIYPIQDQFPSVSILKVDSINRFLRSIAIKAMDDYGLSRVQRVLVKDGSEKVEDLKLENGLIIDRLTLDSLGNADELEVYYRVWDNDGFNGAKLAVSEKIRLVIPTEGALDNDAYKKLNAFSESGSTQKKALEELNRELSKMEESMVNKSSLDWKEKNKLKDKLRELQLRSEQRTKQREELKKQLENLKVDSLAKEQVKDLLDEVSEEEKRLRALEEEIQALMDKMDMKKLKEKLQDLQQENQEQMRQDERLDKLLEDLAFQRDLLKEINQLQELSKDLKEMSKQDQDQADLDDVKEEFEKTEEKLEELADKNKALQDILEESEMQESIENAKQKMDEAQENQKSGKSSEAQQNEQDAAEEMQEMSEKLSSMMMEMQANALSMNIESLRSILENLKQFSLDVEEVGLDISALGKDDPAFRFALVEQRRLIAGSAVIRDSLEVLAQKAPQIQEKVFRELNKMSGKLQEARDDLQDLNNNSSAVAHQYSMMAANELALLLDNSLQSMMSMMAMQKPGDQNCQKPGGAKPKPGEMGKKASEIGKMVDKLQKGSKEGKGEEGSSSQDLGRILSEQEALRQMIKEAEQDGQAGGNGDEPSELLEELDQAEDALLQNDLIGFKERFERIETRLLEDERAEEERRQKEERDSKSGDSRRMRSGDLLFEGEEDQRSSIDSYNRGRLNLVPFYKLLLDVQS